MNCLKKRKKQKERALLQVIFLTKRNYLNYVFDFNIDNFIRAFALLANS
tara:strand:+ start:719 stop:865 length:147 start_codon:yes stop_codon:yes gene_type:complete